jgi:antitoxin component YwqK of YwqJK toxin-antitoxin module
MCAWCCQAVGQSDSTLQRYFYPDGSISSEGPLVHGRPDGHWRSYHENGALKSEGDRVNFQLEGTWKFYGPEGNLSSTMDFQGGKKEGAVKKFGAAGELISVDLYSADLLNGTSTTYYGDGRVHTTTPFAAGKEEGRAMERAEDGRPITTTDWRDGVLQRRLELNRHDKEGLRQGFWQGYWPNGNVQWEGRFVDDKRQGIFKEYDPQGNLKDLVKYDLDEVLPDAQETALLELRNTYFPDGKVASMGSYTKDGKKQGLFRTFNENGAPQQASIYKNDVLVSGGQVNNIGMPEGPWTEYFATGEKRAEGAYKEGRKEGRGPFTTAAEAWSRMGTTSTAWPKGNGAGSTKAVRCTGRRTTARARRTAHQRNLNATGK